MTNNITELFRQGFYINSSQLILLSIIAVLVIGIILGAIANGIFDKIDGDQD